ncbi:unnamed protein product [Cylindrotheca closterium]|uniref:Orc1-like AAA ATPase domain-containing protein n=1 Tax=Cylindrotheca closterium TaxID=2856 RepID=A0AAD2CR44_9STRA|nr:unnamed protein product [Cylindrotheca closterium]
MKNSSLNPLLDYKNEGSSAVLTSKATLKTSASLGPNQFSSKTALPPPLKTAASVAVIEASNSGRSSDRSISGRSTRSNSGRSTKKSNNTGLADALSNSERRQLRSLKDDRTGELKRTLSLQEDSQRRNRNIESLTINKLHYDDIGVLGRDKELGVLKACLKRLILLSQTFAFSAVSFSDFTESMEFHEEETNHKTFKEMVWIKGYSGAGKSTLVRSLEKAVVQNPRGIMVEGKFDVKGSDQPYSGILEAFGQIFQKLAGPSNDGRSSGARVSMRRSSVTRRRSGDRKKLKQGKGMSRKEIETMRQEIADGLKMELGDELQLLVKMIPFLDTVVNRKRKVTVSSSQKSIVSTVGTDEGENSESNHDDLNDGYGAGQERIKFAFRILMRVVSSYFSPLVLVLDDLQWSDVASLEVIDYLISDKHNPNAIMVIGLYRSNEVDDTHILTHMKKGLNEKMVKSQFHMTHIEVGNFFPADVNRVIMKMLDVDDPKMTRGLADICHKRTLGNPYFVVEFITMLKDEGLLEFNLGLLKWVWDEKTIESATVSTDNVVDLVQGRMIKLEPDQLLTLQYAACLGATFDRSALELIWSKHSGIDFSELAAAGVDVLGEILTSLQNQKYIEELDEFSYRWVHDKVQEAALSLIGSSKPKFQFEIGCILYNNLEEDELDESLFTVVDLINSMEVKRRPDFASLNLRAAQKAKGISAFSSAALYVSHGVQYLPTDKWRCHRKLTVRLYTMGTEMELAFGNVDVMNEYYQELMAQDDCTTLEKLPLYVAKLHKLSSIDLQYTESINFNLDILHQFECDLIWKWNPQTIKAQAIQKVVTTRKMLKQISNEFHERQPIMTDPTKRASMLLLSKLLYSCYIADQHWIGVLCATKMVRMTVKYGVHDASGSSFVAFSTLLREVYRAGNEAASLADTGLKLQNRVENHFTLAMTLYISQSFVFAWRKPLTTCLVPYMEGFIAGMRSGNIEFGLWCLVNHHIVIAHQLGKPLGLILARCPNCLYQMEDMKQQLQAYFVKVQWQMMLNLQGEEAETTELKGEIFDMESFPPESAMQKSFTYFAQLELFVYYGEYEAAANLVIEEGNVFESSGVKDSFAQTEAFHRGLAFYAMARKTKQRKYKQRANKVRQTIEKWCKDGCPNVDHFLGLLNAEQASLDNKHRKAEELYKSAIIKAARPGLSHDAALFSERYADFLRQPLLYCQDLQDDAKYRTQEAIRYYTEWGAMRKASMLQKSVNDDFQPQ